MASGYEMRVGDAEREATAAELREHYASGRLTLDELNELLDKTFAAKTRADLDGLMRDLPSARPVTGPSSQGAGWGEGARREAGRAVVGIAMMCLLMVVLLVVGTLGAFGIGAGRPAAIALLVLAFGLLRRLLFGRRRHVGGCGPRRRRW